MRRRVGLLLYERMLATSVTLPAEMLHAANTVLRQQRQSAGSFELTLLRGRAPVVAAAGLVLGESAPVATAGQLDLVIVPAMWGDPNRVVARHPELVDWLREQHRGGARLCSAGTGAYFLARSGVLDGCSATTHWFYFDDFARLFPRVHLRRDYFIVESGRLYSAGSINALADLVVYLVRTLASEEAATLIERHFSHEIRRPYEMRFYSDERPVLFSDEAIAAAQVWLRDHYRRPVRIADLAEHLGVSLRSLNRRFRKATGETPLEYLQRTRMEVAQSLLRETNLGAAEIAYEVGYSDAAYFSRLFRRQMGASPRQYRAMVRAKLFSAAESSR